MRLDNRQMRRTVTGMTQTETLVGTTTRPIVFGTTRQSDKLRQDMRTVPAGTEVYVSCHRAGEFSLRIPRTLLTATVSLSAVEPA